MSTRLAEGVQRARGAHAGKERLLRALRFEDVDRPPLWFMRQAGRYLPEYRTLRTAHSFEQRLHDPHLAAEITLQPLRRFPLDAAVLFSDLLVPFDALGRPAVVETGGPVVAHPVRTPEEVDALPRPDPARELSFVGEALRLVRASAPEHALLGFAGAPFTLACYLVEGRGAKGFPETMRFAFQQPEAFARLLDRLADLAADHLVYQVQSGADAVQLFDTWAEILSPGDYAAWALPAVQRTIRRYKARADAPLLYFARGTPHLLPSLGQSAADGLSVDWRVRLSDVRQRLPRTPLQGNLDPAVLFAPLATVRARTAQVLAELGGAGHVFNLGHGILPGTPLAGVEAMVETVTGWGR